MRFVANGNFNSVTGAVSKLTLLLVFVMSVSSQDLSLDIRITSDQRAEVSGSFSDPLASRFAKNFGLLDDYAGVGGLSKRFSQIKRSARPPHFQYTVDLKPLSNQTAAAHVSWLKDDGGLLMLDDLIPQVGAMTAEVRFEVPSDWKISTTETSKGSNVFQVANVEKAVFVVGRNRREKSARLGDSTLRFSLSGEWQFLDDDVKQMSSEIFSRYKDLFDDVPRESFLIAYYPFPIKVAEGNWEADTRGQTSVIVSSDMHFSSQSLQRLHEQLRHEIFHFWMPNGVNLGGSYDWFYEGFALYESAKTGVATNTIRFAGFLDVLSRAHSIDARAEKKMSLIDASKNRFLGENTRVYARGMVVAFLCDLAMLEKSGGKRSSADILRAVYRKHRNSQIREDGTDAVLAAMQQWPELGPIAERFIKGSASIDWEPFLAYVGLEPESRTTGWGMKVSEKLTGRQKDLLDKLGYNNWRKSAVRMK